MRDNPPRCQPKPSKSRNNKPIHSKILPCFAPRFHLGKQTIAEASENEAYSEAYSEANNSESNSTEDILMKNFVLLFFCIVCSKWCEGNTTRPFLRSLEITNPLTLH